MELSKVLTPNPAVLQSCFSSMTPNASLDATAKSSAPASSKIRTASFGSEMLTITGSPDTSLISLIRDAKVSYPLSASKSSSPAPSLAISFAKDTGSSCLSRSMDTII